MDAMLSPTAAPFDPDPPSYLPMREQPPPRIPDLCPDSIDGYPVIVAPIDATHVGVDLDESPFFNVKPVETPLGFWSTKDPTVFHEVTLRETGVDLRGTEFRVTPLFPDGAISIVLQALHECGIGRKPVHVEWDNEHAMVSAYVTGIEPDQTDAIMSAAIPMMPLGIGIDVHAQPSDDEYTGPHSSRERETFEKEAAEDMRQYLANPEQYGGNDSDEELGF